jgi:hypothetical protein
MAKIRATQIRSKLAIFPEKVSVMHVSTLTKHFEKLPARLRAQKASKWRL